MQTSDAVRGNGLNDATLREHGNPGYLISNGSADMIAPLHVLVVDDHPDTVLFVSEFLLGRRHRVETVARGDDALTTTVRKQLEDPYDLIITDLLMPGLDGLALARALRARGVGSRVALFTGYAGMNPRLIDEARSAGIIAVLEKPADLGHFEQLLTAVGNARPVTEARRQIRSASTPMAAPVAAAVISARRDTQPFTRDTDRVGRESGTRTLGTAGTGRTVGTERGTGTGRTVTNEPFFGTSRSVRRAETPSEINALSQASDALERKAAPLAMPVRVEPSLPPIPMPGVALSHAPAFPPAPVTADDGPGFASPSPTDAVARPPAPPTVARTTGYVVRPATVRYQRTASGLFPDTASHLRQAVVPTSTRIRRSVTGSFAKPPADGQPPTALPPGAAATPAAPQSATTASRALVCPRCKHEFWVAVRSVAYAIVCVHCGQLNRVAPA